MTTRSRAATGPSPAPTASASSSATVGNSARIRRSRSVTWAVSRFSRSSTPSTNATAHSTSSGTVRPGERSATSSENAAVAPNPTSPHSTCSTRKSWTLIVRLARSIRRRIEALPPSTRSRESAAEPRAGPKTRPTAPVRGGGRHRPFGLRQVADVGQHPDRQPRTPQRQHPGDHEHQPQTQPGTAAAHPMPPASRQHPAFARAAGRSGPSRGRRPGTAPPRRRAPRPRRARRSGRSPRAGSRAGAAPARAPRPPAGRR